jgi:LmbE family N-acetylglucosaminyl deacetylase
MAEIMVIAAHPDDEVLGCGGAIARHIRTGDKVRVVIMAEGVTSRTRGAIQAEALEQLRTAATRANQILGTTELVMDGLPDNRLDSMDRLAVIKRVEGYIERWRPSVVYTHHVGDINIDHQVVHHAVVTACRPQPRCPIHSLLFFEVPSSSEWQVPGSGATFQPNWFVDISSDLDLKVRAMEAYFGEIRDWPHPRSAKGVEYLARWRGCSIGLDAAEAFMLGRLVDLAQIS